MEQSEVLEPPCRLSGARSLGASWLRSIFCGAGVAFRLGSNPANTGKRLGPDLLGVSLSSPLAPLAFVVPAVGRLDPTRPAKAIPLPLGALASVQLKPGSASGAAGHLLAGLEASRSASLAFGGGEDHLLSVTEPGAERQQDQDVP